MSDPTAPPRPVTLPPVTVPPDDAQDSVAQDGLAQDDLPEDATRIIPAAARAEPLRPASTPPGAAAETVAPATIVPTALVTPPSLAAIGPGVVLGYTYEIEALLARGGMGEVYRARHKELGSEHAIKVILPALASEPRIISLFQEEARKLRRLRNDAIVAYEGLFRDENGLRYLVMEFVDGPSLAQVLKQRALTPDEVRQLRDRMASGLGAAHEKGIFHRDISPDNIILVGNRMDQAKIIDFGIAKSSDPGDKTVVGHDFAGKYSYVSPEQLGLYEGKVDGRSDIYSLGLVLAAAAIGRPLPMGNSPISVIEARQRIPDLAGVPAELRPEIAPLLEPNPENRPQSMAVLPKAGEAFSFDDLIPNSPPAGASAAAVAAPAAAARRGMGLGLIAGLASFVVVAGAGGAWLLLSGPPKASTAATTALPAPQAQPAATPAALPIPGPVPAPVATPVVPAASRILPSRPQIEQAAQQLLGGFQCSALHLTLGDAGQGQVRGFVGSPDDLTTLKGGLRQIAGASLTADAVAIYAWPHCAVAKALETGATGNLPQPVLQLNKPGAVYHNGDKLVVKTVAGGTGYLYVDYIDSGGSVVHMLPNPLRPDNAVKAGQSLTLGTVNENGAADQRVYEVSEPYGPNMIVAVLTSRPLAAQQAPEQEQIAPYLQRLQAALAQPQRQSAASYKFFEAQP